MATKAKKAAPRKTKAAPSSSGAATATAAKSKDAGKKTFGKAAPKTVKPAAGKTAKPARSAAEKPSVASRVMRRVTRTATGAVAMAASVIGKDGKAAKPKGK